MVTAYTYTRYPNNLDNASSLPAFIDLKTPVRAEEGNRLREAILAMQGELGVLPSGTYTTVRARLDALETLGGGGTGSSITPVHRALTVTVNGQTSFTLPSTPANNILLLWVGGIKQELGDYTVSGTALTWTGSTTLLTSDVVEVLYFVVTSGGGGGGGGTSVAMAQDTFSAGVGQVNFVLSNTPVDQQSTELFIDGISMTVGTDYTLSGSTVVYSGSPALTGGEDVVVKYLYTP